MAMKKNLSASLAVATVAVGAAIQLNETPFMGGGGNGGGTDGRNALLHFSAPVGGSGVVLIQGHDGVDQPASGDSGWFTIHTQNAAAAQTTEIRLPRWIRLNVTVAGTGTPNVWLEGVQ